MKKLPLILMIASLAIHTQTASAQTVSAEPDSTPASENVSADAAVSASTPVLSFKELDEMRGGTQIAINNQTLNAANSGNTINGDFTAGDVSLADDAFSNFSGLGNFVFNTGAQSSLQAGMSITINISE
tara:strand:+ start:754 stop:1140 length:387 start_codon:yes stop_codon:yes gene_type:complete